MTATDKSKKRDMIWKKAIIHFSICFTIGFLSGFFPTTASPEPPASLPSPLVESINTPMAAPTASAPAEDPNKLLILVTTTTTTTSDPFKPMMLERLSRTLRLVPAPVLWVVVEAAESAKPTERLLRSTGVMYRHLVFDEAVNFTDAAAEVEFQRNFALNHVEFHRLDGVVHFAELENVYDLRFFDEVRDVGTFGTWQVASVSTNRKRVLIEGPVCQSSDVSGWHFENGLDENNNDDIMRKTISRFAFNSSILWDPERWGRTSSVVDASQDSMKFVQEVALEDESKLIGLPQDCSSVMVWHLYIHKRLFLGYSNATYPNN